MSPTEQNERCRLDDIATHYTSDHLAGANETYHLVVRDAMIPVGGGESALEIGCGKGLWTKVLCDRYRRVDVVDSSQYLLDRLCRENQNRQATLSVHCSLIEDFVMIEHKDKWDHIFLTFLLEHVEKPTELLRRLKTMLSPHGQLLIAVPNAESVHRMLACRMGLIQHTGELSENDILVGHRRVYTTSMLTKQVQDAGLNIDNAQTVGLKPLSLAQMTEWPQPLVAALCRSGDLVGRYGAYISITASAGCKGG